jgi:hypothetical protein
MDLRCPSCGKTHRTQDYPGAFEINCSCGYSILVPNEEAFQVALDENAAEPKNIAAAQDDEAPPLSAETLDPLKEFSPSTEMTPPDQLPPEMVYDPFELKNEVESLENAAPSPSEESSAFEGIGASSPFEIFQSAEEESAAAPAEFPSEEMALPDPAQAEVEMKSVDSAVPKPVEEKAPQQSLKRMAVSQKADEAAQEIVDRSMATSLGQHLGPSYNLHWKNLSREQKLVISKKLENLVKSRPWAMLELEKREIHLESLPELESIKNIPEIFAVEIYLMCFEFGGDCEFERVL